MTRTAIVGVGSPFGDDRAGWLVIDALQAELGGRERASFDLTLVALDRPGAALLEHLRGAQRAVLIDAARGTEAPGTVARLDATQLESIPTLSSHGFGVAEALALGSALQALPPELIVLAIATDGNSRSADVSDAVRGAANRLARELQRWIQGDVACDRALRPATAV